jgi:nucleoid-associated protein YgaU
MGLFSFIKNAGVKVFGSGKTDDEEKAEGQAVANAKTATENLQSEKTAAKKLEETVRDLKLVVENLKVEIEDDMATVTGKAQDQATKEKVVLVIGNTHGIASVDDQMTVDHVEPESQYHTVIKGETLGHIAKKHYGNTMKYPLIFDANKPMLTNPDKIYPGQVLRIPSLA